MKTNINKPGSNFVKEKTRNIIRRDLEYHRTGENYRLEYIAARK